MSSRPPLVIILGTTGSGKTKLSLELATKFNGEILGADSMQVYKGLDIITAKVKKEEQLLAPHHLIDILEPHQTFTVLEYRNQALDIIDNLVSQNKLPIIVGGTNYYIESILWNILVEATGEKVKPVETNKDHELPSQELHDKLKILDPNMAKRLHPNNKRKILRALEVLNQKGRKLSEILEEQHSSEGGSKTSGALRYPNTVILWIQCEKEALHRRLDERVDEMVKEGLADELTNFQKHFKNPDYTRGIFQSIGFKEFHSFLQLDDIKRSEPEGIKALQAGIDLLKVATKRYARKQLQWIRNRFLGRTDREVPPVYSLDTTNVLEWQENVSEKAYKIVESYISGTTCPYEKMAKISTNSIPNAQDETRTCKVCERIFVGTYQWECHLQSNRHRRVVLEKRKSKS